MVKLIVSKTGKQNAMTHSLSLRVLRALCSVFAELTQNKNKKMFQKINETPTLRQHEWWIDEWLNGWMDEWIIQNMNMNYAIIIIIKMEVNKFIKSF